MFPSGTKNKLAYCLLKNGGFPEARCSSSITQPLHVQHPSGPSAWPLCDSGDEGNGQKYADAHATSCAIGKSVLGL